MSKLKSLSTEDLTWSSRFYRFLEESYHFASRQKEGADTEV